VSDPVLMVDAQRVAGLALDEDGDVDLTTVVAVDRDVAATARIEFRSGGVVSGSAYADAVVDAVGLPAIDWSRREGDQVPPATVMGELRGDLALMLRAERPLLNLLQRACGIATATRAYADAVAHTPCRILHTRKTAPGLRELDVRAVLAGGGLRHRIDLAHEVMIKDNHWRALEREGRSLAEVLSEAARRGAKALYVEVESLVQLELACAGGATRLLIDNQTPATVRAWALEARRHSPGIEIEATGGITLENVREYADAGADFISIGALTHSVRAADVALEVE
jgi:nicotinate-nucleotide pyrophosphorylase (carboxylating)